MHIKKSMKMADVIQMNYMLIPVIHRFGIELGFGDKTVDQVCEENEVDLNFFLQLVNAYHDQDYFPKEELQSIPVREIIAYLKMTHASYLNNTVTDIEQKIKSLELEGNEDKKYIALIRNFFEGYKSELTEHIMREEDVVFPYVLAVDEIIKSEQFTDKNKKVFESFSIEEYEEEHDDVEEKLMDLRTIMIKYVAPPANTNLYHSIIQDLFRLEEDLNYHSRIEDKVLIPKIILMEKSIKNLF
ncbi:hemerythrin domain-containing protein [Marinifilum flexuosum]|uniref:Regulator of cell morphogenesis and NO signaling n=1 Tax=Marinifilum flexuosum TaxID=1117708 RepID=A0A419WXB4_9BACT|nr:hemerythrin domain-containing protein [Marinifilum flexuosum]RKE00088.1 regulator of cell morphogenesis and NO signaling [Marinifilum flexuosum]